GCGVAIELARRHPERIASLTLLSGLGVQEQELFGRYWVNHAVHGVQLAALWLLTEATPHFGLFDRMFMGVEYARNFYDTDQRPLRPALLAYDGPALIYHGRHDFLVPYDAALEH
ncbi:alpha/beta fold hydrolase, partial [Rhizobium leguminosarum]|uniref:alpha/beta fold hydrolase n=1 Tax=Rhizobium leguminosarum TaxID=384 RepID=UPI003F9A7AA7